MSCFMFVFCPANLVVMKVTDTPGVRHYWGVGTRGQHRNEEDVGMLFSIIVFNSPAQSLPLDIRDAKKEMSLLPCLDHNRLFPGLPTYNDTPPTHHHPP